jgi:hypothetical protein
MKKIIADVCAMKELIAVLVAVLCLLTGSSLLYATEPTSDSHVSAVQAGFWKDLWAAFICGPSSIISLSPKGYETCIDSFYGEDLSLTDPQLGSIVLKRNQKTGWTVGAFIHQGHILNIQIYRGGRINPVLKDSDGSSLDYEVGVRISDQNGVLYLQMRGKDRDNPLPQKVIIKHGVFPEELTDQQRKGLLVKLSDLLNSKPVNDNWKPEIHSLSGFRLVIERDKETNNTMNRDLQEYQSLSKNFVVTDCPLSKSNSESCGSRWGWILKDQIRTFWRCCDCTWLCWDPESIPYPILRVMHGQLFDQGQGHTSCLCSRP